MSFIPRVPEEEGSVSKILQPYPEIARPISELTQHVMRDEGIPFTHAERELIGAFVSGTNTCTYCFETHQATAEALGIEEGVFQSLFDDIDSAVIDEKMKPILRYVKKLTLTPTRMTQADADAIFAAGWDERAFHYAVMICGLFNCYNRLLEGYGVKNTSQYRLTAGRELATSGYMHVAEESAG